MECFMIVASFIAACIAYDKKWIKTAILFYAIAFILLVWQAIDVWVINFSVF